MGYTFSDNEVATAAKLNAWRAPASMQAGLVRITPVANTPTKVWVPFPTPFPATPRVLTTPVTIYPGSVVKGTSVANRTRFGFDLVIYRTTDTTTTVCWQAFCATSAFVTNQPAWASLLNSTADALTIESGLVSITPSGVNVETSAGVTFATPFTTVPVVTVCPNNSLVATSVNGWSVTDMTETGFAAWLRRSSTTATSLRWIALGRV